MNKIDDISVIMLNPKRASVKRQRGVVLSNLGLAKILQARQSSEHHENQGEPYTAEKLGELTGLDPHTVSKVFNRNVKVDKRTLQLCFKAFNLTLETHDYQKPESLRGEMETDADRNVVSTNSKTLPNYDVWGEVPDISNFCGRVAELAQLKHWLLEERCRLVMLSGQRGIGKTFLAAKCVDQFHQKFELVIWRSLSTIPPIQEFLVELIQAFPQSFQAELPHTVQGKISALMLCLRSVRCLLVLDGVEEVIYPCLADSKFESSEFKNHTNAGKIPDEKWYRRFLKQLGDVSHQSCVVVTCCQRLPEIEHFVGENLPRRNLRLRGLTVEDGKALCNIGKTLQATQTEWETLVQYYNGNPLFLKIATTTIHTLFNDNITDFLHSKINLYGEIYQRLDQQFQTLSAKERLLFYYLSQQPDHITFKDLRDQSPPLMPLQTIVEALEDLEGRSLIERQEEYFVLQPVIRDYAIAKYKANDFA